MGLFIIGGTARRIGAGGPNLSRSIDAVIRALNFIRSAIPFSTYQMLHFLPRDGGGAAVARIMTPYGDASVHPDATRTRRNKKATSFCARFTHEREFLRLRAPFAPFDQRRPTATGRGVCALARDVALCCCNEFPFVCCKVRRTLLSAHTVTENCEAAG